MKLSELLTGIPHRRISGAKNPEVTSVVYDSRKAGPGSLFVCLTGFLADGHAYARQAAGQGAAVIVAERRLDFVEGEVTVIQVEDTRKALAHLAAAWFGHPADRLCLIGITGTKGKTTTSHMVKKILEAAGERVGMVGTVGAYIGEEYFPTQNTTPEPYELHRLLAKMADAGCRYAVMEVSSQALKQKRTAGLLFEYGVYLNLSPDHIGEGEHKDFAEYLACKKLLFSQTRHAVANVDDPYWRVATAGMDEVTAFSTQKKADFWAMGIKNLWKPGFLGVEFDLKGKLEGHMHLSLPGEFHVENALAAIAVTYGLGVPAPVMENALGQVSVRGRTQLLPGTAHFSTFLIDYAHNALSMEKLLGTLKAYRPGRLICMFGGGGNRPKQRRYDMGRIAGKYADFSIVTTDNPRDEPLDEINREIIRGLEESQGKYRVILDRAEAIHYLIDNCGREDIVVFAGKGHEEYQEIRGRRYHFSEEEVVEEYLRTK